MTGNDTSGDTPAPQNGGEEYGADSIKLSLIHI